ncbi:MAG: hypothetical protein ABI162_01295 [Luteolibacter sp.]
MRNPSQLVLSAALSLCAVSCQAPDPAAARQSVVMEREKEAATAAHHG